MNSKGQNCETSFNSSSDLSQNDKFTLPSSDMGDIFDSKCDKTPDDAPSLGNLDSALPNQPESPIDQSSIIPENNTIARSLLRNTSEDCVHNDASKDNEMLEKKVDSADQGSNDDQQNDSMNIFQVSVIDQTNNGDLKSDLPTAGDRSTSVSLVGVSDSITANENCSSHIDPDLNTRINEFTSSSLEKQSENIVNENVNLERDNMQDTNPVTTNEEEVNPGQFNTENQPPENTDTCKSPSELGSGDGTYLVDNPSRIFAPTTHNTLGNYSLESQANEGNSSYPSLKYTHDQANNEDLLYSQDSTATFVPNVVPPLYVEGEPMCDDPTYHQDVIMAASAQNFGGGPMSRSVARSDSSHDLTTVQFLDSNADSTSNGYNSNFATHNFKAGNQNVEGLVHFDEESVIPRDLQEFIFGGSLSQGNTNTSTSTPTADNLSYMDNLSLLVNTYLADEEHEYTWADQPQDPATVGQIYYKDENMQFPFQSSSDPNNYIYVQTDPDTNQTYYFNAPPDNVGVQLFVTPDGQYFSQQPNPIPQTNVKDYGDNQYNISFNDNIPPAGWSSTHLYRYFKPRNVKRESLTAFRRWKLQQQKRSMEAGISDKAASKHAAHSTDNKNGNKKNPVSSESSNSNNNCQPKEGENNNETSPETEEEVDKVYVVPAPWLTDSAEVKYHDSGEDPNNIIPEGLPYITVKNKTAGSGYNRCEEQNDQTVVINDLAESSGGMSRTSSNFGDTDDCPSVEAMLEFCKRYNRSNSGDRKTLKPRKKVKMSPRPRGRPPNSSYRYAYPSSWQNNEHPDRNHGHRIPSGTFNNPTPSPIIIPSNESVKDDTKTTYASNHLLTNKEIPEGFRLIRVAEHRTSDGQTSYVILEPDQLETMVPQDTIKNDTVFKNDPSTSKCSEALSEVIDSKRSTDDTRPLKRCSRTQTPVRCFSSKPCTPIPEIFNRIGSTSASKKTHAVISEHKESDPPPFYPASSHASTSYDAAQFPNNTACIKKVKSESEFKPHMDKRDRPSVETLNDHPLIKSPNITYEDCKVDTTKAGNDESSDKKTVMINAYTITNGGSSTKNERSTRPLQPDLIKGWYALQDGSGESNHIVLLEENDNLIVLPIEDDAVKRELGVVKKDPGKMPKASSCEKQEPPEDPLEDTGSGRTLRIGTRLRSSRNESGSDVDPKKTSQSSSKNVQNLSLHKINYVRKQPSKVEETSDETSDNKKSTQSRLQWQYSDISIGSVKSEKSSKKSPPISISHSSSNHSVESGNSCSNGKRQSSSKRAKSKVNKKLVFDNHDLNEYNHYNDISPLDLINVLDPLLQVYPGKPYQEHIILLKVQIYKARELLLTRFQHKPMNHLGRSLYQCINNLASTVLTTVNSIESLAKADTPLDSVCNHLYQVLKVNGESLCQMIPQFLLVLSSPGEEAVINEYFTDESSILSERQLQHSCVNSASQSSFMSYNPQVNPRICSVSDYANGRKVERTNSASRKDNTDGNSSYNLSNVSSEENLSKESSSVQLSNVEEDPFYGGDLGMRDSASSVELELCGGSSSESNDSVHESQDRQATFDQNHNQDKPAGSSVGFSVNKSGIGIHSVSVHSVDKSCHSFPSESTVLYGKLPGTPRGDSLTVCSNVLSNSTLASEDKECTKKNRSPLMTMSVTSNRSDASSLCVPNVSFEQLSESSDSLPSLNLSVNDGDRPSKRCDKVPQGSFFQPVSPAKKISPLVLKTSGKRRHSIADENSPDVPVKSQKKIGKKGNKRKKTPKQKKKSKKKHSNKNNFPNLRSMSKNTSILAQASDSLCSLLASSSEEVIPQSVKRGFQYKEECLSVLNIIYNHKKSDYFCHEIKSKDDQYYYKVIKRGMCLDVIATKLRQAVYVELEEYIKDMRLVFSNCRTYHRKGSFLCQYADLLEKLFEDKFKEKFPDKNLQSLLVKFGRNAKST